MKCFVKRSVLMLMAAAALAVGAYADDLSLTLIPVGGTVAGPPGSTVGWGFTLTDIGPDYVVLADSYFTGTPIYGSYTDYIASQFYVAGPAPESATIVSQCARSPRHIRRSRCRARPRVRPSPPAGSKIPRCRGC